MSTLATNNLFVCCMTYITAVVATVAVGTPAFSQSKRPGPFSFDIGTGVYVGEGAGVRDNRAGPALALAFTARVESKGPHALLIAGNITPFVQLDNGDDCVIEKQGKRNPNGGCLNNYPSATAVSAMVGYERRFGRQSVLRLLGGPSFYTTFKDEQGRARPGLLSRVDYSVPANSRVAFVMWGQAGIMPFKDEPTGQLLMFGVGLRLQ